MWCRRCRQDVPGIAVGSGKGIGCARCGHQLADNNTPRRFDGAIGVTDVSDSGLDLAQLGQQLGAANRASQAATTRKSTSQPTPPDGRIERSTSAAATPAETIGRKPYRTEPAHDAPRESAASSPKPASVGGPPAIDMDDWEQESLDSSLAGLGDFAAATPSSRAWNLRATAAANRGSWNVRHAAHATRRPVSSTRKRRRAARRAGMLVWMVVGVGLATLLAGGGLWLASFLIPAPTLGPWGWPIAAVGQTLLLLGLIWQLERVGHANRGAREELANVNAQLNELRQATMSAGSSPGSASQALYSHLADGVNPQTLLADVKSQLDLLAARMSQQRR